MPVIPEMEPNVTQERALPVVPVEAPPAGAFPYAQAEGLQDAASKLHAVAQEAKASAAREQAEAAGTAFLNAAIDVRAKYSEQVLQNAIQAYPQAVDALNKQRDAIAAKLPSQHAVELFRDGSLYTLRREMGLIENHFNTQRKSYGLALYRNDKTASTRDLASLGTNPEASLKVISEAIDTMHGKAEAQGTKLGYEGEMLEQFVAKEMQEPIHALINGMLKVGNPRALEAYKAWGGVLDPSFQATVAKTLQHQSAEQDAKTLMSSFDRIDTAGEKNALGMPNEAQYTEALKKLQESDNPQDQITATLLTKKYVAAVREFEAAGKKQHADLMTRYRGADGLLHIDTSDPDWHDFQALYPNLAANLQDREKRGETKLQADEARKQREAAKQAYGNVLAEIHDMPEEQLNALTLHDLTSKDGVDIAQAVRAWKLVQTLRKGDAPSLKARDVGLAVTNVLTETGGKAFLTKNRAAALEYAQMYQESEPTATREEIKKAMTEWAVARRYAQSGPLNKLIHDAPPAPVQPAGKKRSGAKAPAAASGPGKGEKYLEFDPATGEMVEKVVQ